MDRTVLYLSAGEESGDLHGSFLARELRAQVPALALAGMGGDKMRAAGVKTLVDASTHGVVGLVEVVGRLRQLRKDLDALTAAMARDGRALVAIDYGGFNARLLARAKRHGLRTYYYIPPKLWAWGAGRGRQIAKWADRVLTVFPFEADYWRKVGADVTYVGHPLLAITPQASRPRREARGALGLGADEKLLLVMPGSRGQEAAALWPVIAQALPAVIEAVKGLRVLVAPGGTVTAAVLAALAPCPAGVEVTDAPAAALMSAADAAVAASGTATLELAIMDVPQVILYRVNQVTWEIGRRLVYVRHLGLPNIIAGREAVPELLQGDVTPARVAATVRRVLADESCRDEIRRGYKDIRARLETDGVPAYRRAAAIIVEETGI